MARGKQIIEQMQIPAGIAFSNLCGNLEDAGWKIYHQDEIASGDSQVVKEVFGVSGPMGGSNILSIFFQGVRYVPFFAKIKSMGNDRSEITVIAAGAEELLAFDFGRNEGVARKIIEWCKR